MVRVDDTAPHPDSTALETVKASDPDRAVRLSFWSSRRLLGNRWLAPTLKEQGEALGDESGERPVFFCRQHAQLFWLRPGRSTHRCVCCQPPSLSSSWAMEIFCPRPRRMYSPCSPPLGSHAFANISLYNRLTAQAALHAGSHSYGVTPATSTRKDDAPPQRDQARHDIQDSNCLERRSYLGRGQCRLCADRPGSTPRAWAKVVLSALPCWLMTHPLAWRLLFQNSKRNKSISFKLVARIMMRTLTHRLRSSRQTSPPGGGSCGERQHVGRREATAYGENILGSNGTGEGADEKIGADDAERHAGGREPGAAARPARAVPAAHHRGQRSGSHP